jgi:phage gpG-like protein
MRVRVEAATPVAVRAAGEIVRDKAKVELARKSHARGTPTPSAPGEPPAKITGHLRDTWEFLGPTALGAAIWHEELGPTAVYARIQELGGKAGRGGSVTLPARPYLRPAYEAAVRDPELLDAFKRVWGDAVRG